MLKLLLFPVLLAIAIFTAPPKSTHWTGAISNGTQGDKISFVVSADGKQVSKLKFDGHWRCGGKLERQVVGPDGSFPIVNGKVSGVVLDPPTGATWHFELTGDFTAQNAAANNFRTSITGLNCGTHELLWAAAPVR